jgi:hypothetical protein
LALESSRLQKLLERLHNELDNLAEAIKRGGDLDFLNGKISEVQLQIRQAEQKEDAFRAGTHKFKIHTPSVTRYLKLINEALERLTTAPAKAMDLPLMEELNSLVDRIVVYPNKDDRGFEVEVVGKLARIVSGSASFRGKGPQPNNTVRSRTLTAQEAAERLTLVLPKAAFAPIVRLHTRIEHLLANEREPLTLREIQRRLSSIGIEKTGEEIDSAIHRANESFINIRRNGFMSRAAYDALSMKWFPTTQSMLDAAEKELRLLSEPVSIDSILRRFAKRGMYIYGGREEYILRKKMSQSGRFIAERQNPTRWSAKHSRPRSINRDANRLLVKRTRSSGRALISHRGTDKLARKATKNRVQATKPRAIPLSPRR